MCNIIWLFGVGGSVACNLRWAVPKEWKQEHEKWTDSERDCHIEKIKQALRGEIIKPGISRKPYADFLSQLEKFPGTRQHILMTTNWDTLLDLVVQEKFVIHCPKWLKDTHVFHLNGTIEEDTPNTNPDYTRSTFLLETDPLEHRRRAVESNKAFNFLLWADVVVVVGMSFECNVDNGLLKDLSMHEDNTPIGESTWLIVNCDKKALSEIKENLRSLFPGVKDEKIKIIEKKFEDWIQEGCPELEN